MSVCYICTRPSGRLCNNLASDSIDINTGRKAEVGKVDTSLLDVEHVADAVLARHIGKGNALDRIVLLLDVDVLNANRVADWLRLAICNDRARNRELREARQPSRAFYTSTRAS